MVRAWMMTALLLLMPGMAQAVITDASRHEVPPSAPAPGYLQLNTPDPNGAFDTRTTRIGGTSGVTIGGGLSGKWGYDSRHHYTKTQPWNSDNSLLYIQNCRLNFPASHCDDAGSPRRVFLDGNTYAITTHGQGPNLNALTDYRWQPSTAWPNSMIGLKKATSSKRARLQQVNVITDVIERDIEILIHANGIGSSEGQITHDGRLVALATRKTGGTSGELVQGKRDSIVVVNIFTSTVGAVYEVPADSLTDQSSYIPSVQRTPQGHISISPGAGQYIAFAYEGSPRRHRIFVRGDTASLNITGIQNMASAAPRERILINNPHGWVTELQHASMGIDPFRSNKEVIYGQQQWLTTADRDAARDSGQVVKIDLDTGLRTRLSAGRKGVPGIPGSDKYGGQTGIYEIDPEHISYVNFDRPEWVYVHYAYNTTGLRRYSDELVAWKVNGSREVERFGWSRSNYRNDASNCSPAPEACYRMEPHIAPSRDGKRIVYASNWQFFCPTGPCLQKYEAKAFIIDARTTRPASITTLISYLPDIIVDYLGTGIPNQIVRLRWTAVGADSLSGKAEGYDIRYAVGGAAITEGNFTTWPSLSAPVTQDPGGLEVVTVRSLLPRTKYTFAVKVKNQSNVWSGISNTYCITTKAVGGSAGS